MELLKNSQVSGQNKLHHPFLRVLGWCLCGCPIWSVTYVTSGQFDHLPYTWQNWWWCHQIQPHHCAAAPTGPPCGIMGGLEKREKIFDPLDRI